MDTNSNDKILFPTIRKSITNFLYEEEANISRSKMLTLGSLIVLVGVLLINDDVFAGHRSHSSHASHASHSSGSYTKGGHVSHESHVSHVSHASSSTGSSGGTTNPVPTTEATPSPLPDTQIPQIPQD